MKKAYIGVILLSAAVFFSLTGCGSMQDKIAEKATEGIAEKAVGGNVDITKDGVKVQKDGVSYEAGKDLKWPKEAMGDLPEPKAKISAVINTDAGKGGSVTCTEMSLEDAKAYVEKLKELGYKDGMSISDMDLISYSGKNGSGASATFMYNISPKEGSIMYAPKGAQ
jgi:hypothetical protein